MPSVFLVGFMGSGKSSVAVRLARELSLPWLDLDREVEEQAGCSIATIFARDGETAFRALEHAALARVCRAPATVVALGGGSFCSAENRRLIGASGGVSVFLSLPWEAIRRRLPGDNADRPLFADPTAAKGLFATRLPLYRRADITLELDGDEEPGWIADRIVAMLAEAPCAT